MALKFYYDLVSQPARALYIFLKCNNIPFEPKPTSLMKGEHLREDYKKINPLSLVPIIDDKGFIVKESVGILRYLCREKNLPDHWYPKESKAQAKVDEYLEWHHLGLRWGCSSYFRIQFVEPRLSKKSPLESDIVRYKDLMLKNCDIFENIWLKDSCKFLFGNKISIADILAATELEQTCLVGYDTREGRPKLKAFLENVRAETNPHYDEAHSILEKITKSLKAKELKPLPPQLTALNLLNSSKPKSK